MNDATDVGRSACWWRVATGAVTGGSAGPNVAPAAETDPDPPYDFGAGIMVTYRRRLLSDLSNVGWATFAGDPVICGGQDVTNGAAGLAQYDPGFSTPIEWTLDAPSLAIGSVGNHRVGVSLALFDFSQYLTPSTNADRPSNMTATRRGHRIANTAIWDGSQLVVFGSLSANSGGPSDFSTFDPNVQTFVQSENDYSLDAGFTFLGWRQPASVRVWALVAEPVLEDYWGILVTPM
jgi:hypothetical protein